MISVDEAKKLVAQYAGPLQPIKVGLQQAFGLVLASDVYTTIDIPPFNQSSMDGYAFCFDQWQPLQSLKIEGEAAAGAEEIITILPGAAVRIFTGAPVPEGVDTVVMQEKVIVQNEDLMINDEHLSTGMNIRKQGAEIKAGQLALPAGTLLSPAAIGFLAGIGITNVYAYPKPAIAIIVTGNELQQPGIPLRHGQVYESNSAMLTAALYQLHIQNIKIFNADDKLQHLEEILLQALQENDVVLLTGGISVGDYDFVLEAANRCGVTKIFHRVKQRPGKPLYFGKKDNRLVFGLPGNPSSVLTCFYEYVLPALQKSVHEKEIGLKKMSALLVNKIAKPAGLTHFLKGFFDGEKATLLDAQESYRLSSFARANCFIKIDEDMTYCSENQEVEIHLLPVS